MWSEKIPVFDRHTSMIQITFELFEGEPIGSYVIELHWQQNVRVYFSVVLLYTIFLVLLLFFI